jgi:CubicO group peptidase (beta-lactamase class C family)
MNRIDLPDPALGFSKTSAAMAAGRGDVFGGAAIHVRIDGAVVFDAAFGEIVPGGPPVLVDSPFDLASVTKIVVGTALLALFDERRFALDDPLVSVLPEFAGQDARRTAVTFRHLLTHTSGLPAHVSFRDELGSAAIVGRVCATPLASAPGTAVTYSDLGYILVGAAVERISTLPLAEAVSRFVCDPLGLKVTRFNPPPEMRERTVCTERDSWRGRLLQGEVHDENCWSMGGVSGHAGLFSTASEVADIGEAYRLGGIAGATRLLSRHAATLAVSECVRDGDERRGLGWSLRTNASQSCGDRFGPESFGHTGYTGTSIWVDPDRSLTVALLTNRVYFTRDPHPIFELRRVVHDAVVDDLALVGGG